MSRYNLWTFLILTIREMVVEYRLMTCLPRAFPVFSPFSFSSRGLYSPYVFFVTSSLALSTLPCVHLWHFLPTGVFYLTLLHRHFNLRLSRLPWEPAVPPWSLQSFIILIDPWNSDPSHLFVWFTIIHTLHIQSDSVLNSTIY